MITTNKPYVITRGKVIIDYSAAYCENTEKLLRSELFREIVDRFIERIASRGNSQFAFFKEAMPELQHDKLTDYLVNLFRLLSANRADEIVHMNSEFETVLADQDNLLDLIEQLYNFWRRFERFIYVEAPKREGSVKSDIHHAQFIKANDELKNLVLDLYRLVSANLTGHSPRVYRQLPAGANMGMLVEKSDWDCPGEYDILKEVPFIRISLVEPPLILYPEMNTRVGEFKEIQSVTAEMIQLNPSNWFCFPAKVGELTAFMYFHQDFISLGLSLINLFETADYDEISGAKPDIILLFGLQNELPSDTVFYEDSVNGILMGLIKHSGKSDYFGYLKKMTLTLHNIAMLKRDRLPLHGAMVCVKLKDGGTANVVIVGDSGAGKSETIEAFRVSSEEHICEMTIIFDDMGSLGKDKEGKILGYGTEIGAFVRLDDLQQGYAYEEMDRSIFMNPDKVNSRLIIPITRYHHLIKGYPVDIILYANNYEQIDEEHPAIEFFTDESEAISVFRSGARYAKGTTDEKGLVHTYFANPFGAPQRKDDHEKIALSYFNSMFKSGIKVGQIRTRLGISGYEQSGPRTASIELFKIIKSGS
ncbi:MAG: phosphoenolpyruvate carboxykinase [Nitrospira sp.]|nr:phosphoenolpyruvate carboxykinase [bacterium]MBL7048546.1 phosphoenolpyruvate carboxykinase [Nitrospira sp.]